MNKTLSVSTGNIFLLFAFLALPLFVTHTASIYNIIVLLTFVVASVVTGAAILSPVRIAGTFLPLSQTSASFFIGSLLLSLLLFVTQSIPVLLGVLLLVTAALLVALRRHIAITYLPGLQDVLLLLLACGYIAIVSPGDLPKQFTAVQDGSACYSNDSYYFTSVISSIRHGSIFDAVYEKNTPVNYQMLGFFMPGFLAAVLKISSHQALWGIALPFFKLLASALGYELCRYYAGEKAGKNIVFMAAAVFLPALAAPLHPLYLLKGQVSKFVFHGMGYLVPAGTITYPVAIAVALLCMLLFAGIKWDKKITADKILFALLLGSLMIAKTPLFVSFFIFIGAIVLRRVIAGRESLLRYLPYALLSLALAIFTFKVCENSYVNGRNYFRYGPLVDMFGLWYGRKTSGFGNNVIMLALIAATFVVWLGIRLVGLAALLKSRQPRLGEYFFGATMSLLAATVLGLFLHMDVLDGAGNVIMDGTFNIDQFIRSSFYVITIVAVVGILQMAYTSVYSRKTTSILASVTIAWCILTGVNIVHGLSYTRTCTTLPWYADNLAELKSGKYNDGLIVINPDLPYGISLASSDYGTYWSAMGKNGGNNASIKNEYRWSLFRAMADSLKEQPMVRMHAEGVKYIIATPDDSDKLATVSRTYPQHLKKVGGTQWFYELQ